MPIGEIVSWGDRGFGFLADEKTLARVFVHVSAIGGREPEIGDRFSYDLVAGRDGRPIAGNVRPMTAESEEADRVFGTPC